MLAWHYLVFACFHVLTSAIRQNIYSQMVPFKSWTLCEFYIVLSPERHSLIICVHPLLAICVSLQLSNTFFFLSCFPTLLKKIVFNIFLNGQWGTIFVRVPVTFTEKICVLKSHGILFIFPRPVKGRELVRKLFVVNSSWRKVFSLKGRENELIGFAVGNPDLCSSII